MGVARGEQRLGSAHHRNIDSALFLILSFWEKDSVSLLIKSPKTPVYLIYNVCIIKSLTGSDTSTLVLTEDLMLFTLNILVSWSYSKIFCLTNFSSNHLQKLELLFMHFIQGMLCYKIVFLMCLLHIENEIVKNTILLWGSLEPVQ